MYMYILRSCICTAPHLSDLISHNNLSKLKLLCPCFLRALYSSHWHPSNWIPSLSSTYTHFLSLGNDLLNHANDIRQLLCFLKMIRDCLLLNFPANLVAKPSINITTSFHITGRMTMKGICFFFILILGWINLLWPSDAILWCRSGSMLTQSWSH